MTQDRRPRDIFGPADETIAELNALHAADQARKAYFRDALRDIVRGLDRQLPDEELEPAPDRREREQDRRPQRQEPDPFVRLPERTTLGGPFGPAVRAKLERIALEKSDW